MGPEEALETTCVYSVSTRVPRPTGLLSRRAFRAPHHTISAAALIGGGGLQTWEHAVQFMMWGASLVTACTEIMWRGWDVVTKIVDGMEAFRREQGYGSYQEMAGRAVANLRPAVELETVSGAPIVDEERCSGCGLCVKPGHCFADFIRPIGQQMDNHGQIGLCPDGGKLMQASG